MLNMLPSHPSNKRIDFMDTIRFVEPIGAVPVCRRNRILQDQFKMIFFPKKLILRGWEFALSNCYEDIFLIASLEKVLKHFAKFARHFRPALLS